MFRIKYILVTLVLSFCSIAVFGQNDKPFYYTFYTGFVGQINSYHDSNGTTILHAPGFTLGSSSGFGIPVGATVHFDSFFGDLRLSNRVAKVVDNIAIPNVNNQYRIVQDLYIGFGHVFAKKRRFLKNSSVSLGFNLISIGQPYQGGEMLIPGLDINGNNVLKEYEPSSIQFPAISVGFAKQFTPNWQAEIQYLMYSGSWRQDTHWYNYGSLIRISIMWIFFNTYNKLTPE